MKTVTFRIIASGGVSATLEGCQMSGVVVPNRYRISTKLIAGCLSTGAVTNGQNFFSELFHGSARAIIRSLESELARAVVIARLKHDRLINRKNIR